MALNTTKNNQMHCYRLQEKMQGIMSSKINVFIDSPQDIQQLIVSVQAFDNICQ